MDHAPHLSFSGDRARAEAVVLLLHGGTTDSLAGVPALDYAFLRMVPFGRSVLRAGRGRIALAKLRYAVRGWNGDLESPLADARWAIDQVAKRFHHLPVGLVGHSMGGRVALRVADHVSQHGLAVGDVRGGAVRSVAALAPWLPNGEVIPSLGDRSLLLAHGTADQTTQPAKTIELAQKLISDGSDIELKLYPGGRHDMLFPARPWHDLVSDFMVRTLLGQARDDRTDRLRD
jgi:alpha-beta hydrolase superfamily lysophospholipase